MSQITPQHQTLLLKNSTQTILISQLPTASITAVKESLLNALSSRNITSIASVPVPSPGETERVELGLLVDRKDYRKGFNLLREGGLSVEGDDTNKKGKGKATPAGKNNLPKDSIAAAGLKDGDVIAFRFRDEARGKKTDENDENMIESILDEEDDEGTWDVVFPSYDDEE